MKRFFDKVCVGGPDECHVWTGLTCKDGYGKIKFNRKTERAHRVAFFLAHGRWPEPCCLHRCDNPPCCNPAHLFEGTNAENTADRDAKGRQRGGFGEATNSAKLCTCDVLDIFYNHDGLSQAERARFFGVSQATVSLILSGKAWRHVTEGCHREIHQSAKVEPYTIHETQVIIWQAIAPCLRERVLEEKT